VGERVVSDFHLAHTFSFSEFKKDLLDSILCCLLGSYLPPFYRASCLVLTLYDSVRL